MSSAIPGAVVYICEDEEQLDKALAFRESTPALRKMIVWDMEGLRHFQDPMVMSFDDLLALGRKGGRGGSGALREPRGAGARRGYRRDHLHLGNHGPPKGGDARPRGLSLGRQAGDRREPGDQGRRDHLLPPSEPCLRADLRPDDASDGRPHRQFHREHGHGDGGHAGRLAHALPCRARGSGKNTIPASC